MKFIHTIVIENEKASKSTVSSTRITTSRRYQACLVTTTTAKSVVLNAANLKDLQSQLTQALIEIEVQSEKWGLTYEEALAEHQARAEAWAGKCHWEKQPDDTQKLVVIQEGYLDLAESINRQLSQEGDFSDLLANRPKADALAKEEMMRRGFVDPEDINTSYALVIAWEVKQAFEDQIKAKSPLALGSQAVISWHASKDLAQKALNGHTADYWRSLGDTVEVRTDIKVVEKK